MYIVGGLFLVLGLLSLTMPLLASYAIETLVGCLILAVAFSNALGAFRGFGDGDKPWQEVVMAIACFVIAMIFLFKPLAGLLTLSMLLFVYFLIDGISKISGYFRLRSVQNSIWLLVSGLLSMLLSYMMWSNFATSLSMIGIILGINLTFTGCSFIMMGYGCSKLSK